MAFTKPAKTTRANQIRLTGLWKKVDANGTEFWTGDFKDPNSIPQEDKRATAQAALERSLEILDHRQADAYSSILGHRVSIFPNTNGSPQGGDYRMMFSESVPVGHEGPRPAMAQVASLNLAGSADSSSALRGQFIEDLPNQYRDIKSLSKATLLVTEIKTKRSPGDADAILYLILPTKEKKKRAPRRPKVAADASNVTISAPVPNAF